MAGESAEAFQLTILNTVEGLQEASAGAEAWLEQQGCDAACGMLVSLGIEELVTNCIKYGYDDAGQHFIGLRIEIVAGMLTLEIRDDGHAFDPLQVPPPDLTLSLEERPIGGLGLHLLREMADAMSYERRNGHNVVTLGKAIAGRTG
jgi:serine/threonine-protein kinase RsbW